VKPNSFRISTLGRSHLPKGSGVAHYCNAANPHAEPVRRRLITAQEIDLGPSILLACELNGVVAGKRNIRILRLVELAIFLFTA
jgi:hypothetical protein